MSSPTIGQQPGYQAEVVQMDEIQRTKWLEGQPGFNNEIQGPPTPFAMSVRQHTPLYGLNQNFIKAINHRDHVVSNPNSTQLQIRQADIACDIAKNQYNSRIGVIQVQEEREKLLQKSLNSFKSDQR